MASRHIALFIKRLSMGGIQKIVVRLCNEFSKRGHKVDLLLAKGKGELVQEVHGGVRIIDFDKVRIKGTLPDLLKYLVKEKPDVLFSAEAPINLVALWAKMFLMGRPRVVVSIRSNMSGYADANEVWYGPYTPALISLFYPFADSIIAISKGVLEDLSQISASAARKGCVVYNPTVTEELLHLAGETVHHPWFQPEAPPVILGVGRLVGQKNFTLLLQAFALVRKTQHVRLMILGDGKEREELEHLAQMLGISEDVCLPGFVDNPYKYMSRAPLFVLSSNFEGFGNVVVEALACGCPVVSTNCPSGPAEILQDGRWGRLVPVNDADALADAMREALAEEHDPNRLRERAMDFTVEKAVEAYLDVLLGACRTFPLVFAIFAGKITIA